MSASYVKSTSYELQAGSALGVDHYGMDMLRRKYRGKLGDLNTFLSDPALAKDAFDKEGIHPNLKLVRYDATEEGSYAIVLLTYKGLRNDIEPPIKEHFARSLTSISLVSSEDVDVTAFFYAETLQVNYLTKTEPAAPLYADNLSTPSTIGVFGHSPASFDGQVRLGFEYALVKRDPGFTKDEVITGIWAVEEVHSWEVEPL